MVEYLTPVNRICFTSICVGYKKRKRKINISLKTPVLLHIYADSAWKWQFVCVCVCVGCRLCLLGKIFHSYWSSSSISSRRGPYSRTYAICQSPPPDSRRMSSGDTTLTLSSSNFTHSSVRGNTARWWTSEHLNWSHSRNMATVQQWETTGYLLSSWPSPRSDLRSWSGLGVSARPAGRSSRCCWTQGLEQHQTQSNVKSMNGENVKYSL